MLDSQMVLQNTTVRVTSLVVLVLVVLVSLHSLRSGHSGGANDSSSSSVLLKSGPGTSQNNGLSNPAGFPALERSETKLTVLGQTKPSKLSQPGKQGPKTILITGALGCIGTEVVKRMIEAGYEVIVVDVSDEYSVLGKYATKVRFVQADIRDEATMRDLIGTVSGIVHMAAMSRVSWCAMWAKECMDINLRGTAVILEAIEYHQKLAIEGTKKYDLPWLVFASSREVFGGVTKLPVSEDTPQLALNVYGNSKIEAEKVVKAATIAMGLHTVVIRFSNVYGCPKDHEDRVIPNFVRSALSGLPLLVSGSKLVDFTYITDAANGVFLATRLLLAKETQATTPHVYIDFNLATGDTNELLDVARWIVQFTNSSSNVAVMRSDPIFVDRYITTMDKTAKILHYTPQVPVREGLQHYIRDVRDGKTSPFMSASDFRAMLGRALMLRLYDVPTDVQAIGITKRNPKIVIIGAGVCGICAALRLKELGYTNYEIIEGASRHGGLAQSFVDDHGFTWDIGVHVLFSHFSFFDHMLDAGIPPKLWAYHVRGVKAYMRGGYVDYPVQNNLFALPENDMLDCVMGVIDTALKKNTTKPGNFHEWILQNFGQGLADAFLLPYNYKVWAHPAVEMNSIWVGERVATLDVKDIVKNTLLKKAQNSWGPNAMFRYPMNGTGQIWDAVFNMLPQNKIRFGQQVANITALKKKLVMKDGSALSYDALITSMPLDRTVGMLEPQARPKGVTPASFKHQTVNLIGIGIRGRLPSHLRGVHWLYFPEEQFPFYRVTILSSFSPNMIPGPDYYSVLAEVSESKYRKINQKTLAKSVEQAYRKARLLLSDGEVVSVWQARREYGYPVPYLHRDKHLRIVDPHLRKMGIWSRGRFGAWKYEISNQDHVCMQGVEAVDNILLGLRELEFYEPDLINGMHRTYPPHLLLRPNSAASSPSALLSQPSPPLFTRLPEVDFIIVRCTEDISWLSTLVRIAIPEATKFTVHVYDQCEEVGFGEKRGADKQESQGPQKTASMLMWDAIHHVIRYPLSQRSGGAVRGILHHLSGLKITDNVPYKVFLNAQQGLSLAGVSSLPAASPNLEAVNELRLYREIRDRLLHPPARGFTYVGGKPVLVDRCPERCDVGPAHFERVYSHVLNATYPTKFRSNSFHQFFVTRHRIMTVPAMTWKTAMELLDGAENDAPALAEAIAWIWHVLFGEPPL